MGKPTVAIAGQRPIKGANVKKFLNAVCVLLAVGLLAVIEAPKYMVSQATLRGPSVSTTGLLNLTWTAGTVNNGGHAVAITSGSTNATAAMTSCAAPIYSACNFLYANSSGTVSATTTLATAMASGNTLLAMAETNGTVITKLSFPNQAADVYTGGGIVFVNCGTSASCTSPTMTTGKTLRVVSGTTSLSSGTPSAVTISGMTPGYTSTSTYRCEASPVGGTSAIAAGGAAVNLVSGTSFTITGPDGVTTAIAWSCFGY